MAGQAQVRGTCGICGLAISLTGSRVVMSITRVEHVHCHDQRVGADALLAERNRIEEQRRAEAKAAEEVRIAADRRQA